MVPISEASLEYAQQVRSQLRKAKLHVDVDATDRKMQKKVREAQLAQYNYILVSASVVTDSVLRREISCLENSLQLVAYAWMGLHCQLVICTVGSVHSCFLDSFFYPVCISGLLGPKPASAGMGDGRLLHVTQHCPLHLLLPRLAPELLGSPHRWWVSRR